MSLARALFVPPGRQQLVRASSQSVNVRDPRVATNYSSSGYQRVGGTMIPEWDAESAIHQAYLANVFVYACVSITANTIASLPFRAGKNPDEPQEFDLEAPLARLLGPPPGSPNPDTSPSQLWAHSIAQYIITGRFGWELEKNGSEVVALWPLIAQYLEAIPPSPGERFSRWFKGFAYTANGQRTEFQADDIYYDWKPSQHSWHQPESALQAARLNISGAVMQDVYDFAFLKNDARPAAMVITEQWATEEDKERFEAKWNSKYGGPANAGRTIFTEVAADSSVPVTQMVDIKQLGLSQKDSMAVDRYSGNIKAIVAGLGVPMSKLDASERTFSNASEEDKTWWESRLIPLVRVLQEKINVRLAPLVGKEVGWFDLSGVEVLQKGKNYVQVNPIEVYAIDGITKNELRDAVGEESLGPEGDKFKSEYEVVEPEVSTDDDEDQNKEVPEEDEDNGVDQEVPEPVDPDQPDESKRAILPAPIPELSTVARDSQPQGVTLSAPALVPAPFKPQIRSLSDNSNGVMVAFWLTPEQARELAIPGGQSADSLHVTLAYLGKVQDGLDEEAARRAIDKFADWHDPIIGSISGKGEFSTPDGIAVVALVDAPGLSQFRVELVKALADEGVKVRTDHDFTPHITLAYVDKAEDAKAIDVLIGISIGWQQIALSWGSKDTFFALGAELERQRQEEIRTAQWRSIDAQVTALEGPFLRTFQSLFNRQEQAVVSRLKGKRGRQLLKRATDTEAETPPSIEELFNVEYWQQETEDSSALLYSTVIAFVAARLIGDFGLPFDPASPVIADMIKQRSLTLSSQVTETTFDQIANEMNAGLAAGETSEQLAERIHKVFEIASRVRSETIAQTETISAFNQATYQLAVAYGKDIIAGKGWLSVKDGAVRDSHRHVDGDEVAIDQKFEVGGYLMDHPGDRTAAPPAQVINCRCFLRLISFAEWMQRERSITAKHWRAVQEVEEELIRLALGGVTNA